MTGYFDVANERFTCGNCQWSGTGVELSLGELFAEIVEYDCLQCGERVTFAASPTREEALAAAQTGNEAAATALAQFDQQDRRWQRLLETRARVIREPPELAEAAIHCGLDIEERAGDDTWLVLVANGYELHRELAVFESTEPAHRLLAVMRERYGDRLRSFNYEPALQNLGGDRLGSAKELEEMVSGLPGGGALRQRDPSVVFSPSVNALPNLVEGASEDADVSQSETGRPTLILVDIKDEDGSMWRAVTITDDGGLAIVGHDLGHGVERTLGFSEYEFERRLSPAEVTTLRELLAVSDGDLLAAVRSRFPTTGDLESFVTENGIAGEFWNSIGD